MKNFINSHEQTTILFLFAEYKQVDSILYGMSYLQQKQETGVTVL